MKKNNQNNYDDTELMDHLESRVIQDDRIYGGAATLERFHNRVHNLFDDFITSGDEYSPWSLEKYKNVFAFRDRLSLEIVSIFTDHFFRAQKRQCQCEYRKHDFIMARDRIKKCISNSGAI